ncbi:DUF4376 domain-containing protein [Paracidovorax oryzae]|uniref:DUF4376 domain-containing protein n=1 Tax=Paracidovorax oryzae TaxID=862720 RepID=UPI0035D11BAC
MQFINTQTRRWPMSMEDVVAEEQAVGVIAVIGDGYQGHGPYRTVGQGEQPPHDPLTEFIVPLAPEADEGGNWVQGYEVRPMSAGDIGQALQADKARLMAAATARRRAVEAGGLALADGKRLGTSIEDQNRINGLVANAEIAGLVSVDFKSESGWITLSVGDLHTAAAAMVTHVQSCFSAERKHHEAIAALQNRADAATYDLEAGWPI